MGGIETAAHQAEKILGEVDTFEAGYITFFPSSGNSIKNDRSLGETIKGSNPMQGMKIEKRLPSDGPGQIVKRISGQRQEDVKRNSGQRQDAKGGKKMLNKTNGSTEGDNGN